MTGNSREGKETIHRDLLTKMLESQPDIERHGSDFAPSESVTLELLLKSGGGGPAPLSKVDRLSLHDDFVAVRALEATSLLPYSAVVGIRVIQREKSRGPGFTR